MAFRVYDTKRKRWVERKVYLNPYGEIFTFNKSIFGCVRLSREDDYVYHLSINLNDKFGKNIYEGDFLKAEVSEDRIVYGMVTYAQELSSYIMLCNESNEYFVLGKDILDHIQVVGNVFDGYKYEQKQEDKQTL